MESPVRMDRDGKTVKLHCLRCQAAVRIAVTSLAALMRSIHAFVDRHSDCKGGAGMRRSVRGRPPR